ncbi:MAG TPA: MBL fold metallo-hydrolase [Patescibacteria group bacterium]|nr:MBL fold metallo-hydrolase [Patescibacteria group bacterium]
MREVAEGVYQIEVPMRQNPLGYTYSYLLKEASTIIDTGAGSSEGLKGLDDQMREAGLALNEVKRIIVTHLHGDHVGLVDYVREVSGASVVAHRIAMERQREAALASGRLYEDLVKETKLMGAGKHVGLLRSLQGSRRGKPYILEIDELLDDGDILDLEGSRLRVYWTPGHAREHICLHDEERRILYAGDHILPKITPHMSLHGPDEGDPLGDYLTSLDKLRGLPVRTVLPAHEWIFDDLDGRIDDLKLHHVNRCNEMKNALRDGANTVFEVSSVVHWDSRPWAQMSFWTRRMAAAETLAHLVYMRNKGDVVEELRGEVLHYSVS